MKLYIILPPFSYFVKRDSTLYSVLVPHLLSFQNSACFCNPINKIIININKSGTKTEYNIESLLTKYENGGNIIYNFKGFIPDGCHQEVDLEFERKDK